ncbi:hypothetical protein, partial [Acinetobacter baumannii]|uniref:hypothetical protein n=1 Tax=Acinetobacter baumannii TaxID=470 RepID=UPI001969FB98
MERAVFPAFFPTFPPASSHHFSPQTLDTTGFILLFFMPYSCLFSGIKKTEGLPGADQETFGLGKFFLFKERYFYLRIGIFFSTHSRFKG